MKKMYYVHASTWDGLPNWDVCLVEYDENGKTDGPMIVWSGFSKAAARDACIALENGWCMDCFQHPCACRPIEED